MSAQIPQPMRDGDSQPYWEGLEQGKLLIQRCASCSHHVFYPRSLCPHCFSEQLSWVRASGKGTIYSYTVAHQAFGPFAEQAPFVVAIVELEEGVRMLTRIVAAPRERIAIGAAVHVTFEAVAEDMTLPYFRLAE
ncbi:Zn-ribbon domain-containing OB-fold protein [Ktedonosporobacter rubrisoli]|uniref:Zn-ribbon domain-containing OB-fold protein n=1 Tax=Ktedonosporobacter rubrisoli TaxID=2509675 RepID=A0A4P6JI68_KTERU|nr:Zn-ribbon domain-containing OB-fold protein [Ktedonosporobacter rubrisoli]QBD74749.1 Zn-ribbon domain-containing OB-fold protein [Ktedonosporobacter rubrisoli]